MAGKRSLTSAAHRSGTERVHEISNSIAADVYVNVQGDEPLTRPEHIATLLEVMKDAAVQVGTLKTPCGAADINNPGAVKVVTDSAGRALYFSRATIPFDRDGIGAAVFQTPRHVCLPQGRAGSLRRSAGIFAGNAVSAWSSCAFWRMASPIYVGETPYDTVGVDTEEDLRRVVEILSKG